MMVVVGLLAVIILGLMAMFSQTQRAFRLGMTQTDVLEGGRVATDMIVRELEQVTPSYLPEGHLNSVGHLNSTNFFVTNSPAYVPLLQWALPGSTVPRENLFDDVFFITHENQTWTGIGYFVRNNGAYLAGREPVGTLYRVQVSATDRQFRQNLNSFCLINAYFNGSSSVSRILDGVVHFRIRAYDTNGNWITPTNMNVSLNVRMNYCSWAGIRTPDEVNYFFSSNAVPACVELELGILEQSALDRYKSIPAPAARLQFLINQTSRVHLFRQRVAIRNVDPLAYR
jgi:hypothetical protein